MDVTTHLLKFDEAFITQAIELARTLPEAALDQPMSPSQVNSFAQTTQTLRELLDRMVFTKEVWVAAVRGEAEPPNDRLRDLNGLRARLNDAYPKFLHIAQEVQAQARWQQTFVDAVCEPPEIFPYGGMLAHVLNVDAYHRHVLSLWFSHLGITLNTDPMHFGQLPQAGPLYGLNRAEVSS